MIKIAEEKLFTFFIAPAIFAGSTIYTMILDGYDIKNYLPPTARFASFLMRNISGHRLG